MIVQIGPAVGIGVGSEIGNADAFEIFQPPSIGQGGFFVPPIGAVLKIPVVPGSVDGPVAAYFELWPATHDNIGPHGDEFGAPTLSGFDAGGLDRRIVELRAEDDRGELLASGLAWVDGPDAAATPNASPSIWGQEGPNEPSAWEMAAIDWFAAPPPAANHPLSDSGAQKPIPASITGSDVPLVAIGQILPVADDAPLTPLSDKSMPLIGLDDFQADIRFAGIDGSGFAAVILDTGIDVDHPFFGADNDFDGIADRIVYQYDFADGDTDASDHNGHGSNVSSIVASSDSEYGGVAPGADIIHLKVFSDSGSGSFGHVEAALQWVVDNAVTFNIASVNMSLGDGGNHTAAQGLYGVADELAVLAALDVITVSAAGNKFYEVNSIQGVQYPAADPNSLSIGAVYDSNGSGFSYGGGAKAHSTSPDALTPFSQRGADLTDIFAPGAPITGADEDGGLTTMHGTSQASPHIAGIAVLAQQLASETLGRRLTVEEFTDLLINTGVVINDGDDEDDNVDNTGLDFGRVDVHALGEAILGMVETTVFYAIAATDAEKAEGDADTTPFTFTITRSGDTTIASEVNYAVTGSGTSGADAADFGGSLPAGTLTFAENEVFKNLTIDVSGDLKAESDEVFSVTLSQPSPGSGIATATATSTITNDDQPGTVFEVRVASSSDDAEEKDSGSVSLTSSDLELIDDRGPQTVGIRFDGIEVPQGAIIVNAYLQFQVDEADAGTINLAIRGEATDDALTFTSSTFDITSRAVTSASAAWSPPDWTSVGAAGADQQTSDLTAIVQEIVDRDGWASSNAMAFVISGAGKRVAESFDGNSGAAPLLHIEYQEAPAAATTYAIAAMDAVNPEGDGGMTPFTFTVTRSGDTSEAGEVDYTVTGNGADGGDFGGTLPSGKVSFVADETSKVLTINVSGDGDVEANEGFTVTLSNPPSNSAITTASADGTIENDDAPPPPSTFHSIAATDAVKAEGDSGATPFTFTVTRSGDTAVATQVGYAVTGIGADAADFGGALPAGTLDFAADEETKIISIEVSGDNLAEVDEDFTVTLSNPSVGSDITTAFDTGTILNDDVPSAEPVVFEARVASSSDDAEEKESGSVSLSSSDLEMIDDRGPQTVGIRFDGIEVPQGAIIVNAYLQFQVDEADSGAINLAIRGEASDDALTFSSNTFDITSRAVTSASANWSPPDWTSVGAAGVDQQTSDLTTIVQEIVDRDGWAASNAMAFVISGNGKRVAESFDGNSGAAPLLHIEYQEAPAAATTYAIAATDAVNSEGNGGTTPFTFTVTRSGDTSAAGEIDYTVTGSGADAADFGGTLPTGQVSFAADETSKVLTIYVSGDTDVEANEGFTVTLTNAPADSAITTASAEGTIENDDAPPPPSTFHSIAATDAVKAEGDSGATPFTFTVTRSGDTTVATQVSYAVTGIDADAADFGGVLPFGIVEFAANELSKDIVIEVSGDGLAEADEGFTVTLFDPSSGSGIITASDTGTILNDDVPSAEPVVFEVRVASSSDDAEEKESGSVSLSSTDLEMIDDRGPQTVGIRFDGVELPKGAIIVNAYLQFQVDETDSGAIDLEIRGEASDDALTFSSNAFDITSRDVTSASASWSPPDWNSVGAAGADQQTSDLKSIVQEIVNRDGWASSNAMAFMISGEGKRVAESFDGKPGAAPLLHIEYEQIDPTDLDLFF